MSFLKSRHSQASGLDRLFEKGVSGVDRMPQKTLSDKQIRIAAAASKTGAGIWLLSHAKEIALCAVSFAAGVGGTLAVTHALHDNASSQIPTEETTLLAADSLSGRPFTHDIAVYPAETSEPTGVRPENRPAPASTGSSASSQKHETVQTTPKSTATPTTPEPVVIKKTIIKRDTIRMRESVIVKDTMYVIEN